LAEYEVEFAEEEQKKVCTFETNVSTIKRQINLPSSPGAVLAHSVWHVAPSVARGRRGPEKKMRVQM